MKTIRYLFYMILLLSNVEVKGGDYSIDALLDFLQENGYYDIIQSIKNIFGDDIAIDVCKELAKSNNCEEVVRVYMTVYPGSGSGSGGNNGRPPVHGEEILKYFEKNYKVNQKTKELIGLILSFYDILIKNMNEQEIIVLIENIIQHTKIKYINIKDKFLINSQAK